MVGGENAKLKTAAETAKEPIPIIARLVIEIGALAGWNQFTAWSFRERPFHPAEFPSTVETGSWPIRWIEDLKFSYVGVLLKVRFIFTAVWSSSISV